MIAKSILLLSVAASVLAKPAPNPISIYQQDDADERQYQQPQQPQQIQQYRPQQYKQQAAQQTRPLFKQAQGQQQQSEDYEMEPPQPYQFSFDVNDDINTNYQNRKEQREGNKITGSYSVVDSDGFIRTVTYTADPVEGFKAHVSREPTDIVVKIPEPERQEAGGFAGSTKAGLQYNGAPVARPAQLRPQAALPSAPRRQQTQQYLQGAQDPYAPFQGQQSVRVSQAVAQGGQANQFLSESSPDSSQLRQFSNSNTSLRG